MTLRFSPARGSAGLVINSLSRGPTGAAATLTAGTATTGAAGSSAAVTNSGSTAAAVFDLTIPRGADAGMRYAFESSTTMAAPASGGLRFNNATIGSATAAAINITNLDGVDVSTWIKKWDDSTNTTKAYVAARKEASGAVEYIFELTSVTDNTTWLQLNLTYVSGSGSLSASDHLYLTPFIVGNKGADGQVAGPVSSTVGNIATYGSTDGKTLADGGFLATAIYRSGGTDVAIADGGTGASTAADAATNLGLGTGSSPQFTAVNIGHASDTTVTRTGAGDIAVEGNAIYRAGGTDVPVTDGGTGSSTASDALTNLTARGQGKETIFIPAAAMVARTTNGPSTGTVELTTNKVMVRSLDFDTTTQEFAQFSVWFPKSWNLSTVTFQASFSQLTTAAGGVTFGLAGVAVSSGDDLDVALGTAQTSNATAGTLNKEYQTAESSAITIAGTPAAGDRVIFQVNRTVADAGDTLAQDARLHGIRLFFTTNAVTDA